MTEDIGNVLTGLCIISLVIGAFLCGYGIAKNKYQTTHIKDEIKKWKKEMRGKEIKIIKPSEAHREE